MTFPYPENPDDWQKAYTRDHAHRDSEKHGTNFWLPLIFCYLIVMGYLYFHLPPFLISFVEAYPPVVQGIVIIVIALLFFLFFTILLVTPSIRFASSFFTEFYCPPEDIVPSKIINYRLFGKPKLPPPLNMFSQFEYIIIKDGEIINKDKGPAWSACNLGGPITLIVFDGCALYLERGNRFSRIVGPGEHIPFLEWYETIKYVVDLRPKVKTDKFNVWTKDGIKIHLTAQIECRIGDPSNNDPINGIIFPYDPEAVKKAVDRYALRWPNRQEGEPSEFTWIDAAWGQVTGIVPGYVGGRMLDDLFIVDRHGGQIFSPDAFKEIFGKLNQATNNFGVFITDFQILKVDIPEEVYEHQKDYWRAERQGTSTVIDGQAKAFSTRVHEKAKADTQRDLIMAIAQGLMRNRDGQFTESLLLSLSGVLDGGSVDPADRAYFAKDTLDTIEQLQKLLDLDHPPHFLESSEENNDNERSDETS